MFRKKNLHTRFGSINGSIRLSPIKTQHEHWTYKVHEANNIPTSEGFNHFTFSVDYSTLGQAPGRLTRYRGAELIGIYYLTFKHEGLWVGQEYVVARSDGYLHLSDAGEQSS